MWWVEGGVSPNYGMFQTDSWVVWPDGDNSVSPGHSSHLPFHSLYPLLGQSSGGAVS